MTIKLLTFDLDNTLWDVDNIVLRADKAMRQWIRQQHPEFAGKFDFRDFLALREAVQRERSDIAHDFTQMRLEVLRRAFLQAGYSRESADEAAQGAFDVFFHERNIVELFPGVQEGLQALSDEFELYAISNGNADIQRVGLGHVFTRQFSAISVGAAKPDPRIYRAAIEASGAAPQEIIHIGDHPLEDVQAAAAVGMKTVWVNYRDQPWPEAAPADGVITTFSELLPLVRRLSGGK